jgi:hypothetical protein
LFITVCFSALSQSLTLSDTLGAAIPNNSTIALNDAPDVSEVPLFLWVKNVSGTNLNVRARKREVQMTTDASLTFCWAGNCFPPSTNISLGTTAIAAGATAKEFSAHFAPNSGRGQSKVRYTFWNEANIADSVSVNVDYNMFPAGIENITAATISSVYPNPASTDVTVSYAIPTGEEGRFVVRNLLGSVVKEEILPEGSGKLGFSVAGMTEGLYFYSLLVNGQPAMTKKMIVRH